MRTLIKTKHAKQSPKKESNMSNRGTADERTASSGVSSEEKHQLIANAAYFRAEQRSFAPGYELDDWLRAEAEVKTKLLQLDMSALPKH
jgi:hypothetical protein